jgi:hypothetical protein
MARRSLIRRPLKATPCRCERPLVDDGSCVRCGRDVDEWPWPPDFTPTGGIALHPAENTPLRRAA